MQVDEIIKELERNRKVFHEMLYGLPSDFITWKLNSKGWCILEIVCNLRDEEKEDFRTRVEHVLKTPFLPLPPFDQLAWIEQRNYIEQDFNEVLAQFMEERKKSIAWLKGLADPKWENAIDHPHLGKITALTFLHNWLAHDYHHIRQINMMRYNYHKKDSGDSLTYAGKW